MLDVIISILGYLTSILITIVIVQFVLGLLMAFNVIPRHNEVVMAIYTSINAILDPFLAPIRRLLPNTGAIDFSPLVLIILLNILQIILSGIDRSVY